MSYLEFDKKQLINLEYSLNREILRANGTGAYTSTTLSGCNTRKYHGLLICPISNFGGEKHLLLSSLDISVVREDEEFNLGIHRYKGGVYQPKGHRYIRNIVIGHVPLITYRIGDVIITMEKLLVENKNQILIRYYIENAPREIKLRFKPFLAFRNVHNLSKANLFVNRKYYPVTNGIGMKLYEGYPDLYMNFSKPAEFIPVPDWYYNVEYYKELRRGYEYLEDLFVPGYFELNIKQGENLIFAGGTEKSNPLSLKQRFTKELNKKRHRYTFISSLNDAGKQFIYRLKNETFIIAGFPWYESITRQTFIALPGLALATNDNSLYTEILGTCRKYFNNGLFPDNIYKTNRLCQSADAPLWFIWAVQHYLKTQRSPRGGWLNYSTTIKKILKSYKQSVPGIIKMTKEGLINAEKENVALTWMDSFVDGQPVVRRAGLAVEINALWYNAVCFALKMAKFSDDKEFIDEWRDIPEKAGTAFLQTFCNKGHDHLADYVSNKTPDWSVRPNMVIAAAMEYSPLSKEQKKMILSVTKQKLLTKRGLRTLSPDHLMYKGVIEGNPEQREASFHQGAVYPWLMQFFVKAYLDVHGRGGMTFVKQLMEKFEEEMTEHCVGTLSEMYNGDPPHKAKGAVSQAWNVAGVIYALNMIKNYKSA